MEFCKTFTTNLWSQFEPSFLHSCLRGQIVPYHTCQVFFVPWVNRAICSLLPTMEQLSFHFWTPWDTESTGKQSEGTLCSQLSRVTELSWDRTNPMRDAKQTPLWQFFAILNQLEVFHDYYDSLQASNVYKAALCYCLNSYRVWGSWKYTSHRTQTPVQRSYLCSKHFQILSEKYRCPTKHNS